MGLQHLDGPLPFDGVQPGWVPLSQPTQRQCPAAMACTIAVEEVIGEHYADQAERLGDEEAPLRKTIAKFRDDELEHRDIAVDHRGREAMFYAALKAVIQQGCRTAIRIAERV